MAVNMFCEGQKVTSKDYSNNYDAIFKRYWVVLKTEPVEIMKCRKLGENYQEDYFDITDEVFIKPDIIDAVFMSEAEAREYVSKK